MNSRGWEGLGPDAMTGELDSLGSAKTIQTGSRTGAAHAFGKRVLAAQAVEDLSSPRSQVFLLQQ